MTVIFFPADSARPSSAVMLAQCRKGWGGDGGTNMPGTRGGVAEIIGETGSDNSACLNNSAVEFAVILGFRGTV
ncbi:hypothetical protein [Mangrovibacter yixingensis]|uniref:hypothetical protein n=1 Tax=Mangrovibacter yixingensis TaxID=1529639 RepID=UPI001CFB0701|nr:hypothetical protein [Mangrovibacter yixingensis]